MYRPGSAAITASFFAELSDVLDDITHDAGGTLDVVCSRGDLPSPSVDVHEIGLSDHRLLCWTASLHRSVAQTRCT